MKSRIFLILGLIILLQATTGCSRKTVAPIVVPVHDTVYQKTVQHDSTYIDRWHTHYEYIKGDTVHQIDSFYVDKYIEKKVHDTIRESQEVPVPYEVEKIVEKKLNLWQKTVMWLGYLLIFATVGLGLYKVWQWRKRSR